MSGIKITNKAMELSATFSLTDAEVDCISRAIKGGVKGGDKAKKITEDEITETIQGIFECLVMKGITTEKPSIPDWLEERTAGMSPTRKASYIRGWRTADERLRKKND